MESITVGSHEELLSLVPGLIGFQPADSFVMINLAADRVHSTVRIELSELAITAVRQQVAAIAAKHADRVLIVTYSDGPAGPGMVETVTAISEVAQVIEVLTAPNAPQVQHPRMVECNALAGRRVLESWAELVSSVAFQVGSEPHHTEPLLRLVRTAAGRDALIAEAMDDVVTLPGLLEAVRATPDDDPHLADLASVLAVAAYRHGDGSLARVAVDRALASEPTHRLALLLVRALAAGVSPELLAC